jgi:hypothetical protein
MGLCQRCLLESRGLVGELMGCESWGMLGLKRKGILVLELMGSKRVRIETVNVTGGHGVASMHAAFGSG